MRHDEVDTGESFDQGDFVLHEEVGTLSLELLVGLLLHYDDDITWLLSGVLVSLAVECVFALVWRALVNLGINDLLLFLDLLAFADLALVGIINSLSLATAVITRTLRLGVHARSDLGHASDNTTAAASRALLDSAFFATEAIARLTDAISVHGNLRCLAIVDLLESDFHWVHDRLALLWS